jgi:hypothetical protein
MATSHVAEDIAGNSPVATGGSGTTVNAIELLQSDHRQVAAWFDLFQRTSDTARRQRLVTDICTALEVHMRIEEEIFYPAFLEATGNEALHDRAIIEHEGARELIRKILVSSGVPADHYLPARVAVLAGLIQHRVNEEEKPGGLFAVAALSGLDLAALGARIERRRKALLETL